MRILITTCLMLFVACISTAGAEPPLRISGPPIAESIPFMAMAMPQAERTWEQSFEAQFVPWHSPDMLRTMVASEQVDAAIITTAAASTLRSRGVNCRVVLLHEAPVWIVSSRPGADTLESLKGRFLFPFGPGEMPEIFYKAAMAGKSINVTTRHTGGALEAVNLLLAGRGDHAMLSEPMASIALQQSKAKHDKGAPLLVKRVDMRKAWIRAFPGHHLAASCISFFGPPADNARMAQDFRTAYIQAYQWIQNHPDKTLELIKSTFPAMAAQMERGATHDINIHVLSGQDAQQDALFFLARIHELSPPTVGGSMPGIELFEISP